jgi:hypothetical protein
MQVLRVMPVVRITRGMMELTAKFLPSTFEDGSPRNRLVAAED